VKNLSVLYCGILLLIVAPWCGLILGSNVQLGGLQPAATADGDPAYPKVAPGVAEQGRQVYIAEGCIYCHTQQTRPESGEILLSRKITGKDGKSVVEPVFIKPDIARGWAKRGTVARDYVFQTHPLLGFLRNGPDLADVGSRGISTDPSWLMLHLYNPQIERSGSMMPPFRFLFSVQKKGDQPSPNALKGLPDSELARLPAGTEVVPTARAEALVAYLRSLKLDYELPEAAFAP